MRTLELVHRDQLDLVAAADGEEPPRSDRPLTVEVWYPALAEGEPTPYTVYLRDGETTVELTGRAHRDARPDPSSGRYPLVVISHGYPGNRFLLSPLAENLASKGYVVASIDHTDSTYRTRAAFVSTLLNRPLDQRFVLDELSRLGDLDGHFLQGLLDAGRSGLVGYSMGGYGAIITAGGGLSARAVAEGAPGGVLARHRAGSDEHAAQFDPRFKAVVAFAPWGMANEVWDREGLAGVRLPIFFVAGSADEVSGYEKGVRAMFEQAIGVDRYLLTFENAGHNAAAPMPAPDETVFWQGPPALNPFGHYADPVWDTVRMNNVAQHFVTAYFGLHLRGDSGMAAYLDLIPNSGEGVWARDADGTEGSDHTYWKGFAHRTAVGLRLDFLQAEPEPGPESHSGPEQ